MSRQLSEERAQSQRVQQQYAELERRAATSSTPQFVPPQARAGFTHPMRSVSRQSSGGGQYRRASVRPTNAFGPVTLFNSPERSEQYHQQLTKRRKDDMEVYKWGTLAA